MAIGRLNRASVLAYATSYSEAHDDVEGVERAIAIAHGALDQAEAEHPNRDSMKGVVARDECRRRIAGLRQWYWQKGLPVNDLDMAIRSTTRRTGATGLGKSVH